MFSLADVDGGGTLDASEFVAALSKRSVVQDLHLSAASFKISLLELADTWAWKKTAESYSSFLSQLFDIVTESTADMDKDKGRTVLATGGMINYGLRDLPEIMEGAMYRCDFLKYLSD